MLMELIIRRVFCSAGASKYDGVRSTSTDRTFVLPKVGEGNSVGISLPFGLGLFFSWLQSQRLQMKAAR